MLHIVMLGVVALLVFLVLWGWISANKQPAGDQVSASPKAKEWTPGGDHIENLKAHETVNLAAIEKVASLNDLPVWVSHSKNENRPNTYDNIFWEIEPMGEYLYYLAGDYSKNEKGLLRFPTATVSFRVEHCFEDDVISVDRSEYFYESQLAIAAGELPEGKLLSEVSPAYNASASGLDRRVGFASLGRIVPEGASGNARVVFHNDTYKEKLIVVIIYEEFRTPLSETEHERQVKIRADITDLSLPVDAVVSHMKTLVEKYRDTDYLNVSGAIRM